MDNPLIKRLRTVAAQRLVDTPNLIGPLVEDEAADALRIQQELIDAVDFLQGYYGADWISDLLKRARASMVSAEITK